MANNKHQLPTINVRAGDVDEHSTRPPVADTSRSVVSDVADVPTAALRELRSLLEAPETEGFAESAIGHKPTDAPPPPTVAGYEINGELGQGGMGAVFRARDLRLHRDVAIKVLRDDHVGRGDLEARFIAEAQIHAQLQHPGVAPLHAQGEAADGRPYFAMKVVQGDTLAAQLNERTDPADERPRFIKIFEQICQTLAYAHARRVIHRDLKPGNIMVGAFGEVQVMDWGLAKVLGEESDAPAQPPHGEIAGHASPLRTLRSEQSSDAFATRAAVGTLAYMPPEQAAGDVRGVNQRADVFGLGAILTEILTGSPPYQFDSTARMLQLALKGRLAGAFDRLDASGADAELVQLAKHCLAPAAGDRPRDAGVVTARVTHYLESAEARLRQAELARAASEVKVREERRQRKLLIGLAAASVVAAGAIVASIVGAVFQGKLQTANNDLTSSNRQLRFTQGQLEQAQADLKRVTYFRLVSLAMSDWHDNNGARASAVLADCPPGLRHWEWYYLHRLMDSTVLRGHVGSVMCVAFSPDGKRIVSGGTDGTIKVWDAQKNQELFRLEGHFGPVNCAAFSPDGARIVSGGRDYTIKVWDLETRQLVRTFTGHKFLVSSLAISPDGTKIVSGSRDYAVRIWNAATGEEIRSFKAHDVIVNCVAISPDGKQIVSGGGDSLVKIWDADSGQEVRTLRGHTRQVRSVAFSVDGKSIASGGMDNLVKIWDVATGEAKATLQGHSGSVRSVSFSPDDAVIVSGSEDSTLRIWDVKSSVSIAALKAHANAVLSAAFSKDGKRIVSGSGDGTLRIWDAAQRGTSHPLVGHGASLGCVAFSPNGAQLVSGGRDNVLKVWNLARGQVERTLSGHTSEVTGAAFSPDGLQIVSSSHDGTVRVWDAVAGAELRTLSGHAGRVTGVAFRSDGKRIVSGGTDNNIIIWDATTGESLQKITGHAGQVHCVAFSPDGKHVVAGGWDGKAQPHETSRAAGAYSLTVWDAESGEAVLTLDGHLYTVACVAYSPDGKLIVSGSWDQTVKVWDAETGKELRALKGHSGEILGVAFSPDGKRVITGGSDGKLKVWDETTGDEALSFKEHFGALTGVAFSPDGKHIASSSADQTLRIWTAYGDWDGAPPVAADALEGDKE